MPDRFDFHSYVPAISIDPANAALAAAVAFASFAVLRTALALGRRELCKLTDEESGHTWAEILKKTLDSTSTLAVIATSLLVGLAVLSLPPPWNERVKHLWFIGLGV